MPIDFAPPQPNAQPFQITPTQYTDPLQTLAQMGQLRNQALQGQLTSQELQQKQMEMNSQRAMMQTISGVVQDPTVKPENYDQEIMKRLQANPSVLPTHAMTISNDLIKRRQDLQGLEKGDRELLGQDTDAVMGAYSTASEKASNDPENAQAYLDQANAVLQKKNAFRSGHIDPLQTYDPAHMDTYLGLLQGLQAHNKQLQEQATLTKTEAETEASKATAAEAKQKTAVGNRQLAAADLQAAPLDQTGVPTPAADAKLKTMYPGIFPDKITPDWMKQFIRSTVPAEKQPEFDLNTMKAFLGMMGNTEFDQYLLQGARGINKTPATLSPSEFQTIFQKYSEDKQDPIMRALAISLKGLQTQQTQATLSSMPTEQGIQDAAKELVNGDFSPDQIKDLRSGRTSGGPRILEAARAYAKANNLPFSMANLEIQANTRQDTETKFATGPEAQMTRSFDNLMQHTAMLKQAWEANKTSDFPVLKRIANALGIQFGNDAATTYDLIADYVSNEAAKAFLPSGGGESERARNYSHFERGLGDKQISSNITGLMGLADAQREGLERQYQEGTYGKGPRIGRLFSPQALQARDQLMGKKPAAALQYVRTSTGPDGIHKIGQTADGKWHDVQTGAVIQ